MSNKTIFDYRSEALQGTIKLVDSKGNTKNCIGTKPIMLSNQWKQAIPKGSLLLIDDKLYRLLKLRGTIAEVLTIYDPITDSQMFSSNNNNIYENSDLDTYCNETFYNSLSKSIQNAIVEKEFRQDAWYRNYATEYVERYNATSLNKNYEMCLTIMNYGETISRKCYATGIQDIIDYLEVTPSMTFENTTLTSENMFKMFWNKTTGIGVEYLWLRSARMLKPSSGTTSAYYIEVSSGSLNNGEAKYKSCVHPAFQIDLSKIDYAIL